jgi:hypothetical protein
VHEHSSALQPAAEGLNIFNDNPATWLCTLVLRQDYHAGQSCWNLALETPSGCGCASSASGSTDALESGGNAARRTISE